jgi:hypothetical protein
MASSGSAAAAAVFSILARVRVLTESEPKYTHEAHEKWSKVLLPSRCIGLTRIFRLVFWQI